MENLNNLSISELIDRINRTSGEFEENMKKIKENEKKINEGLTKIDRLLADLLK